MPFSTYPRRLLHPRRAVDIATRLVCCYVLLLALSVIFPGLYPRLLQPLVRYGNPSAYSSVAIRDVSPNEGRLAVEVEAYHFTERPMKQAATGPSYQFVAETRFDALNLYPVVFGTLWLGLPMGRRKRFLTAVTGLPLLLILGTADVLVQVLWTDGQAFGRAWQALASRLPETAETLQWADDMRRRFARLTAAKSFLATGGRPFLAILAGALCLTSLRKQQRNSGSPLDPEKKEETGGQHQDALPE